MTEEIIESNKLIAEFMGAKYDKDTSFPIHPNDLWLPIHGIVNPTNIENGKGKIIQYHSSFDWLMPVVEKIESLGYDSEIGFHNFNQYCHFNDSNSNSCANIGVTKKEAVYKAVIEFIKWYNQNK